MMFNATFVHTGQAKLGQLVFLTWMMHDDKCPNQRPVEKKLYITYILHNFQDYFITIKMNLYHINLPVQ